MTNIHKARIKKEEGTTFIYFYDKEIKEELFRNPQNMKIVVAESNFKQVGSLPIYFVHNKAHVPLRKQIAKNLREELKEKLKMKYKQLYIRMADELGGKSDYAKAVLTGKRALRTEYVLILTEKYDLNLDRIFFGNVKEEKIDVVILRKIQNLIKEEENSEVRSALRVLLRNIFTRIDNARTSKDKQNICDDLLDVLATE
jgi:hypothetical protein